MKWEVGEIAVSNMQGDPLGAMDVRIIHVDDQFVIAVPHINPNDPVHARMLELAKKVGVNPFYANCKFDGNTGKASGNKADFMNRFYLTKKL